MCPRWLSLRGYAWVRKGFGKVSQFASGRGPTHEEMTGWLFIDWVSMFPETQQLGWSGHGPSLVLGVFVPLSHSDLRT